MNNLVLRIIERGLPYGGEPVILGFTKPNVFTLHIKRKPVCYSLTAVIPVKHEIHIPRIPSSLFEL
jgi:hypothetical protein